MKVKRCTPRTEMQEAVFIQRAAEFSEEVAKTEKIPGNIVDWQLMRFITYSIRVDLNGDGVPFEFAGLEDSADEMRGKFVGYLDNADPATCKIWDSMIENTDKPVNSTIAPEALPEDAPAKKK